MASFASARSTFDFGFTYALRRDIQFDAGMNIGLTSAADDLNPFIGFSRDTKRGCASTRDGSVLAPLVQIHEQLGKYVFGAKGALS